MKKSLLLTLLAVSCCESTSVIPPPAAERISPPIEWKTIWEEVEECSGLSGNFDRVRWFRALEPMYNKEGRLLDAQWYFPRDIYVAPKIADKNSAVAEWYRQHVLGHEIVHVLKQKNEEHPKEMDMCNLGYGH